MQCRFLIRAPVYVQTLKESSSSVHGPRLYNCLPRDLRDRVCALDGFKRGLDGFLATIPDKPSLPHYYQIATGNGFVEQLARLGVGGV